MIYFLRSLIGYNGRVDSLRKVLEDGTLLPNEEL